MKIAAALKPFNNENLLMIKQIGVDHIIYYDMHGMPMSFEALKEIKKLLKPET